MRRLVADALDRTRDLWPDIRRAYGWVHGAARILNNAAGLDAAAVARRFAGLVAAIGRHRAKAGALAGAVDHFLKVTRSYRPGLFHGYAVADLPRTNNELEQLFGSYRRHERRATGRKANGSATVLRGPVRLARRSGHPAAPPGRRRSGRRRSAALARGARQPRAPSARPRAAGAVPPRSRCLPQPARTAPPPASFAGLVFLYAACSSGLAALACRGLGTCALWPSFLR